MPFQFYRRIMTERPYLVAAGTSGLLASIADLVCQEIEFKAGVSKPGSGLRRYDWRRNVSIFGYGVGLGGIGVTWLNFLDRFVRNTLRFTERTIPFVASKVVMDLGIFSPLAISLYYVSITVLEGKGMEEAKSNLVDYFWASYTVDLTMWSVLQSVNFACTPLHYQLLVVNCGEFVEDVLLSWILHNGVPEPFQRASKVVKRYAPWLPCYWNDSDDNTDSAKTTSTATPAATAGTSDATLPVVSETSSNSDMSPVDSQKASAASDGTDARPRNLNEQIASDHAFQQAFTAKHAPLVLVDEDSDEQSSDP